MVELSNLPLSASSTLAENLLRRQRTVILLAIGTLAALAWLYLWRLDESSMTEMAMPMALPWKPAEFLAMFVMWSVMMVAMMTPSVAPMVLTFAAVQCNRAQQNRPYVASGFCLAGYLAAWTLFSALATLVQWGLHAAAVLNPHSQAVAPWLGGIFLVATGIYQLTPAKNACLRHCRSPLDFLAHHWREGQGGAFVVGLHHGLYCIGCCWLLMALLFVGGVMNLLWVAAIAVFVLLEKVWKGSLAVAWVGAAAMLLAGFALLGRALTGP